MAMSEFQDDIISIFRDNCIQLVESLKKIKGKYLLNEQENVNGIIENFNSFGDKLRIWSNVKYEIELSNKSLRLELQNLQLKLRAKKRSTDELTNILSSQGIQIYDLKQQNERYRRDVKRLMIEIMCFEESQFCLNNQVYRNRLDKNTKKIEHSLLSNQLFTFNKVTHEEVEQFANSDTQSYSDKNFKFEKENDTLNERDNKIFDKVSHNSSPSIGEETISVQKFQTMYDENDSLKENLQNLQKITNKNMRVKAELEAKCLFYQKSIDQNNNMIDVFENLKTQLCEKLKGSLESEKNKNAEIIKLMREINDIKMHMFRLEKEKEQCEILTLKINENFQKMIDLQGSLKKALKQKDSLISKLTTEKQKLLEENTILRKTEYDDKKTIRNLVISVNDLKFQKEEMAASHYEELCNYNETLKNLQQQEVDVESRNEISKISKEKLWIKNLEKNLLEKEELVLILEKQNNDLTFHNMSLKNCIMMEKKQRKNLETAVIYLIHCIGSILRCPLGIESFSNQEKVLFILEKLKGNIIRTTQIEENQLNRASLNNVKIRFPQIEGHCSKLSSPCNRIITDLMKEVHSFVYFMPMREIIENETLLKMKPMKKAVYRQKSIEYHSNTLWDKTMLTRYQPQEMKLRNMNPLNSERRTKNVIINLRKQNEELLQKLEKLFSDLKYFGNNYTKTFEENKQLKNFNLNFPSDYDYIRDNVADLPKTGNREEKSLEDENRILKSHLQQSVQIIRVLRKEKLSLQECVRSREELLRKAFAIFKLKIQKAMQEANEKFFLQRLCSDLKIALKIILYQNKGNKGMVVNINDENNQLTEKKISHKYIKTLIEKKEQLDFLKDSFGDMQYYIDSMKKETLYIQSVLLNGLCSSENS